MIRRPPRSTLFPTRRSSDLAAAREGGEAESDRREHRQAILGPARCADAEGAGTDRKSTRLNSSHLGISYAVFCLKKKKKHRNKGCGSIRLGRVRAGMRRYCV